MTDAKTAPDPYTLFDSIVAQVRDGAPETPIPMALATANAQAMPSVRIVLLKEIDPSRGFCFFTHYSSAKGKDLSENPFAEVMLFFADQGRQIRIQGKVQQVSPERSQRYWESRPRDSQLSGATSMQSQPVSSRSVLESQLKSITRASQDGPVARPHHWGGYDLLPTRWEFWAEGPNRLHHRVLYSQKLDGKWSQQLLQP